MLEASTVAMCTIIMLVSLCAICIIDLAQDHDESHGYPRSVAATLSMVVLYMLFFGAGIAIAWPFLGGLQLFS